MTALYNEIDPYAVAWLQNLVAAGHVAPGAVDERSVVELSSVDVADVRQFHTFAGVGVWSYALRLAGWPDDRPVWTGSCPCQPFSSAGKRGGFGDERHLWPAWFRLIRECRPPVIFGEQVASKDGLAWLDAVCADLEGEGYAVGAADLCAAGVGAPHIRQRLFFVAERVADADNARREGRVPRWEGSQRGDFDRHAGCGGSAIGLADAPYGGRASEFNTGSCASQDRRRQGNGEPRGGTIGLGDADRTGQSARYGEPERAAARSAEPTNTSTQSKPSPTNGHWRAADWLYCRDGKWRPVESGTFPLAYGAPARVGRLRAYGNAIVAQAAAAFIAAYADR